MSSTPQYEKRPQAELSNFAWCLLVAVKMAKRDGLANNKAQEHIFIMRWLETAMKRKLFPKSVASDILWLQGQGKRYSFSANLLNKVQYIWNSATGEIDKQNDLFKLTYFIETLKDMGWTDVRMSPEEWIDPGYAYSSSASVYIRMKDLATSYNDDLKICSPLELRFSTNYNGVLVALNDCSMKHDGGQLKENYSSVSILPED